MKRFEYKTVEIIETGTNASSSLFNWAKGLFIIEEMTQQEFRSIDTQLNRLGQQGWELVSTTQKNSNGQTNILLGIFKREIR